MAVVQRAARTFALRRRHELDVNLRRTQGKKEDSPAARSAGELGPNLHGDVAHRMRKATLSGQPFGQDRVHDALRRYRRLAKTSDRSRRALLDGRSHGVSDERRNGAGNDKRSSNEHRAVWQRLPAGFDSVNRHPGSAGPWRSGSLDHSAYRYPPTRRREVLYRRHSLRGTCISRIFERRSDISKVCEPLTMWLRLGDNCPQAQLTRPKAGRNQGLSRRRR